MTRTECNWVPRVTGDQKQELATRPGSHGRCGSLTGKVCVSLQWQFTEWWGVRVPHFEECRLQSWAEWGSEEGLGGRGMKRQGDKDGPGRQGLKPRQGVLQGLGSHQILDKLCVWALVHSALGSQRLRTWEQRSRWQNRRMWSSRPPTNTWKTHLHVEKFSQNTHWTLAEDLIQPKLQERSPQNWIGWKKKKKIRNQDGTCAPGGSFQRGKVPLPWEPPSPTGRSTGTDREPQRRAQQPACGRQDRGRPAQTVHATLLHFPAQDTCLLVCGAAGGWNSGLRTLAAQRQPEGPGVWSGARLGVLCAGWSPGLLSTCVWSGGRDPTTAASFSGCSRRAWLHHYELWEHASASGLPTRRGRAEIWTDSWRVRDFSKFRPAAASTGHLSWLLALP